MAFDTEKEPGGNLEEFEDELSSAYREEEEESRGDEGEDVEEEVAYEAEESGEAPRPSHVGVTAPVAEPTPQVSPKRASAARKPAMKTKGKKAGAKPTKKASKARTPARKAKKAKRAKKGRKSASKKRGRRR